MPYCCQCGNRVGARDAYCGSCGTRQPGPSAVPDYLSGVSPRTASLLCYVPILGWLAAIVVLASARFRRDMSVRFHAFQGLYLFVAWLIVDWALSPMFGFSGFWGPPFHRAVPALLKLALFLTWIFMMIKTAHGEQYKLPILGDLAEKSLSEQR